MPDLALFLDDGGVMNDNRIRGEQWQRAVGEFFAPRLGAPAAAWGDANYALMARMFAAGAWEARLQAATDYAAFDRAYQLDWLHSMCAQVGVPTPPEADALALAHAATAGIIPQVRAAFPGAVGAIRTLHRQGYALHTASGESSVDLAGYLTGMGVRDCFRKLYGPDLINTFKIGPEFYTRLLADAGVDPARAVVVDDNLHALGWAAEAGARTVLVGPVAPPVPHGHITALADLPALLARLPE
jgi:HAD superfamily hydrolase (TIGR01509 family)